MAQIRQLKSGFWQAVVRKKGFPPKSKSFPLKRDAEIWGIDVEAQMNRGIFNDFSEAEGMTIAEGLERYLKEVTPHKKGSYQDTNRIKKLIENKTVSSKTLATFKSHDCSKYRDELASKGLAPSTIHKELSVISCLYEVALKDWGIHCINPVKLIVKPKVENSRERRLSSIEEDYLVKALTSNPRGEGSNKLAIKIYLFSVETGMRKSEPFKLEYPKSVDLEKQIAFLKDSKNGKPRAVPLTKRAVEIIKGLEEKAPEQRRGKVFKTTYSALTQSFRRAVKRAIRFYEKNTRVEDRTIGFLEDFTFHDLRHEATTRLADKLQMHELMKVTGHRDARMLARYYHPKPEDLASKIG